MPTHATLHRYTLILEKISSCKTCSLKTLSQFLNQHDLGVSERTVSRDIEQMRHEFGLEIIYDAALKSYLLNKQDDKEIESFLNFITLAQTTGIIYKNRKEVKELMQYLHFDSNQRTTGIEHLKELLQAIKNHRYINFKHTNYHTDKVTPYRIKPLLLKQYQYRWYVIGETHDNKYRTFGCDRITNLETETKTFVFKKNKELRNNFEQVIGLDYSNETIEKIRIQLTPLQARYVNGSPLHSSQYIVSENKEATVIALEVIPNYELTQKIMMLGDQAKVLSPPSLRNEIKAMLKSMLELYKR